MFPLLSFTSMLVHTPARPFAAGEGDPVPTPNMAAMNARLSWLFLLSCLLLGGALSQTPGQVLVENWRARPEKYDYLQVVTLEKDGTGELLLGDHQFVRHEETLHYNIRQLVLSDRVGDLASWSRLLTTQRFELRFLTETGREYSGQLELDKGPFEFKNEGPVGGRLVFDYRLTFNPCPFPAGYVGSRQYYGHQKKP